MVRVPSFVEIQSHDDGDLRDLRAADRSGGTAFGAFAVHHCGIRFKRVYGGTDTCGNRFAFTFAFCCAFDT